MLKHLIKTFNPEEKLDKVLKELHEQYGEPVGLVITDKDFYIVPKSEVEDIKYFDEFNLTELLTKNL